MSASDTQAASPDAADNRHREDRADAPILTKGGKHETVVAKHERRIARSRKHWRFEVSEESEEWVISYMDMVTLMMCAFVVIAALLDIQSSHSAQDFSDGIRGVTSSSTAVEGVQIAPPLNPVAATGDQGGTEAEGKGSGAAMAEGKLLVAAGAPAAARPDAPPAQAVAAPTASGSPSPSPEETEANAKFEEQWRQAIASQGLSDRVSIAARGRSVTIQIQDEILFATGQADLEKGGRDVLRRLSQLLAATQGDIRVEGHTDNVPIDNERFASNWELSSGRAASVVRGLIDAGIAPSRLRATGYADTKPVQPNDNDSGRARNRRVSLIIER